MYKVDIGLGSGILVMMNAGLCIKIFYHLGCWMGLTYPASAKIGYQGKLQDKLLVFPALEPEKTDSSSRKSADL